MLSCHAQTVKRPKAERLGGIQRDMTCLVSPTWYLMTSPCTTCLSRLNRRFCGGPSRLSRWRQRCAHGVVGIHIRRSRAEVGVRRDCSWMRNMSYGRNRDLCLRNIITIAPIAG